jgi:hypothetical protein
MPNEPSATYAYCIVKSDGAPKPIGRAVVGLAEASRPRWLDVGNGYRLVVADAPLSVYGAEQIDSKLRDIDWTSARAAEHDRVIESVGKNGTVVPLKLFTLFATEERAIAHVKKMKKSLDRIVERIADCDEWSLRIVLDEARAAKILAERAAQAQREAVSGTNFLQRKKAEQDRMRSLGASSKRTVDELFSALEGTSKRALRRAAPNRELAGRVVLDAVFLVPRDAEESFKDEVAKVAPSLADEGHHIGLSGPWPAYSFIED